MSSRMKIKVFVATMILFMLLIVGITLIEFIYGDVSTWLFVIVVCYLLTLIVFTIIQRKLRVIPIFMIETTVVMSIAMMLAYIATFVQELLNDIQFLILGIVAIIMLALGKFILNLIYEKLFQERKLRNLELYSGVSRKEDSKLQEFAESGALADSTLVTIIVSLALAKVLAMSLNLEFSEIWLTSTLISAITGLAHFHLNPKQRRMHRYLDEIRK